MRLFFLCVFPVLIIGCMWFVVNHFFGDKSKSAQSKAGAAATGSALPGGQRAPADIRREYLQARVPVVAGLPHTAPIYHELTQPKVVPAPSGCVSNSAGRCECFTAQATKLAIEADVCRQIVAGGFFEEWREQGRQPHAASAPAPSQVASRPLALQR